MATAHVQTKTAISASATSVGVSLTSVGSGNHLTAFTAGSFADPTATTSTPTATWAQAHNEVTSGNGERINAYYSENVASGSWTVTCNLASAGGMGGIVSESSGVATAGSLGQTNAASAASGSSLSTGSITATAGSILYIAETDVGGTGSSASTVSSGFTVRSDPAGGSPSIWDEGTWGRAGDASDANVAAGAINPTWTLPNASTGVSAIILEFKAPNTTPTATESDTLTEAVNIAVKSSDAAGLTKEEAVVSQPASASSVSKFANANAIVTTGWTNPTNAYADDGVYATAAPAKNTSVTSDYGFPAFTTSDIPAGSTINSVTAEIQFKSDVTTSTGSTIGLQLNDNGTLQGSEQTSGMTTTDTLLTHQVTTGISLSDLGTANFVKARVAGKRAGSNTTITWSVDYVKLTVNYTPAPTTLIDAVNVNLTDSASETESGYVQQASNPTNPTATDSGTLSDTASNIGVSGPSDTGSASESGAIGFGTTDSASVAEQAAIKLAQTDPAAFAEQVAIAASVAGQDSTSVVEAIQLALSSSDSSTLVEQLAVALAHQDTAALSDLVQIALAQTQSVSVTDTASNIGLGQSESASASESSAAVGLGTTESSSLTEQNAIALFHQDLATFTEQVAIAVSSSDTASQTEQASSTAAASSTDTATLSETPAGIATSGQDTGSQTDQSSIAASTAATETTSLAEQLKLALQATENASLGEALAIALAHQDAAALQELVGLALGTADTAAFAESVAISVSTSASDSSTLGESAQQSSPNRTGADSAVLAEQIAIALQATDGAGLAESMAVALARQDSEALGELVAVAIAIADVASLSETATSTAQVGAADASTIATTTAIATAAADLAALAEQTAVAISPGIDGAALAEQVAQALQATPEGLAVLEQYLVTVNSATIDSGALQDAIQQAISLAAADAASLTDVAVVAAVALSSLVTFRVPSRSFGFRLIFRDRAVVLRLRPAQFTVRNPNQS